MKLTEQEDQFVKQYLSKILKYRETYDELYDHIVTALSHKTSITSFEQSVYDIVTDDFGGYDNLMKLEKASKKVAVKDTIGLFLIYFTGYFKFPKLVYTVAGIVMIYYFAPHVQLKLWTVLGNCLVMIVFPQLYYFALMIKKFAFLQKRDKKGYVFKPTFKLNVIAAMGTLPIWIYLLCDFLSPIYLSFWRSPHPVLLTSFLIISVLYALSLMKLYRDIAISRTYIILATDKILT
jgi:hypothetical protein